jgi:DNA helicase IV
MKRDELKQTWKNLKKIYRKDDTLKKKRERLVENIAKLKQELIDVKKKKIEDEKIMVKERDEIKNELADRTEWGNNFGILRESTRIITEKKISGIEKFNL